MSTIIELYNLQIKKINGILIYYFLIFKQELMSYQNSHKFRISFAKLR